MSSLKNVTGSWILAVVVVVGMQGCARRSTEPASRSGDRRGSAASEEPTKPSKEQKAEWRIERDRWLRMQREDEKGHIPPDGLMRAVDHVAQMGGVGDDAGLNMQWDWLGPGNIGGRTRAIVINPNNPNQMLLGGVTGGLWRTDNAGTTWRPIDDFLATLGISCIFVDPRDPDIVYIGTGEGFPGIFNNPQGGGQNGWLGNGIFRSLDAWNVNPQFTQMPQTAVTPGNQNFQQVTRIWAHEVPFGRVVYAATAVGVFVSNDIGFSWQPAPGWGFAFGAADIKVWAPNPANPSNYNILVGGFAGAFLSTDQGVTFNSLLGNGAGRLPLASLRVEFALTDANANTVYASVNVNGGEIWRSTNAGATWQRMNTGNNYLVGAINQGQYDNTIWVAPDDANLVVVGGIDLWRSSNGGTTLDKISDWRGYRPPERTDSAHADQHIIIHHPAYDSQTFPRVFVGNDGGIFRNDDIVNTGENDWTELNNSLGITQFYKGAGGPRFFGPDFMGFIVIGGTQDNCTLRLRLLQPAWGGWNPEAGFSGPQEMAGIVPSSRSTRG